MTLQTTGGEQIVFDEGAPTASAISLTEGQGGLQVRLEWLAYRG